VLYAGDDWSEDHHDVGLVDAAGRRLARARLDEGVSGIARLHELVAAHLREGDGPERVVVGIETGRGPWVAALAAAGYRVYAINPRSVARYRERHSTSGAKSDAGDAWLLADLVRTDAARHRPVAGDSPAAEGIKVLARAHLRLIWERNRSVLRLRSTLREYFPAALEAFPDLAAPDVLELLARAPDPAVAARLSRAQVAAALKRARRCHVADKTAAICAVLRAPQLTRPAELTAAYAATVVALTQIITAFNQQIPALEAQVGSSFRGHRSAGIYLGQPGLGRYWPLACWPSSAMTRAATPPPRAATTTPPPAPSPGHRARRGWSWPAMRATTGPPMPAASGRFAPCAPHQAPAPATTSSAPGARATTPRCASSATGWSASCTAA
jgi:transposase